MIFCISSVIANSSTWFGFLDDTRLLKTSPSALGHFDGHLSEMSQTKWRKPSGCSFTSDRGEMFALRYKQWFLWVPPWGTWLASHRAPTSPSSNTLGMNWASGPVPDLTDAGGVWMGANRCSHDLKAFFSPNEGRRRGSRLILEVSGWDVLLSHALGTFRRPFGHVVHLFGLPSVPLISFILLPFPVKSALCCKSRACGLIGALRLCDTGCLCFGYG